MLTLAEHLQVAVVQRLNKEIASKHLTVLVLLIGTNHADNFNQSVFCLPDYAALNVEQLSPLSAEAGGLSKIKIIIAEFQTDFQVLLFLWILEMY